MHRLPRILVSAAYFVLLAERAAAESGRIRGENGEISLTMALPLTNNGDGIAWMHMAAAMLAVDQFNNKDPVVVKELQQYADCNIRFVNVTIVDTGTNSHQAMMSVLNSMQINGPPDAIAGPSDEMPALELSVLATGMETPMVAFRGLDQNLVLPDKHPFFSQINPDLYGEMEFLGKYLNYTGRTDFIAVLYCNDDSILQRLEVFRAVLMNMGIDQMKSFGYIAASKVYQGEDRGIRDAVSKIAKTGFRTIVLMTSTPAVDVVEVGTASHDFELDRGDHFWVMTGGLHHSSTDRNKILEVYGNTDIGGFLSGMAYTSLFEGFQVRPWSDPFAPSFQNQNSSFVRRLRRLNPVPNYFAKSFCSLNFTHQPGTPFPPDDIFQRLPSIVEGSSYHFDATMAIGIGACIATAGNVNGSTAMTGQMHQEGIQAADFSGASGRVKFRNLPGTPGSRQGNSSYFGILNLLPPGKNILVSPTEWMDPETQEIMVVQPFVYAGGSDTPPPLLRSQPEQNYLEPAARAVGLTLMSIALIVILGSVIWVLVHRHHRVVIAAQPPFLYVLCLGSTITSLVILLSSFDEGSGWTDAMLDKACMAIPWLASLGHIGTYSALFTKLWRVNKVLQFKRARIDIRQVAWPALILVVMATVILVVWTASGSYGWERVDIDDLSGESIGRCTSSSSVPFLVPVGIICFVSTLLTAIMAWKTSDVDDLYSESKWIFSLILVQLQVIFVGLPIIAILQSVSPNGRYVGLSLLISTFPLSTMGLILAPKMIAVRREILGVGKGGTRGSRQGHKVSGIPIQVEQGSVTAQTASELRGINCSETEPAPLDPISTSVDAWQLPRVQTVTIH